MRGINLGDVSFGLNADTSGLDRSLAKLHAFSLEVNKVARSTEEGSAAIAAAMARQERLIASSYQKIQSLNQAIKTSGAPNAMTADLTKVYSSLTKNLTEGAVSSIELGRAQSQITARIIEARKNLAAYNEEQRKRIELEKAWVQAHAENAKRDQSMGKIQSVAKTIDDRQTQAMGKAQSAAMKMDEERTARLDALRNKAAEREQARIQGLGKLQSSAMAENEARVQAMGKLHSAAEREDYRRIRDLGKAQAAAIAENERRTQALGKAQSAAYQEEYRRIQSLGRAHAAAIKEDERRTAAAQRLNNQNANPIQAQGRTQAAAMAANEARDRRIALMQLRAQAEDAARSSSKFSEALKDLGKAVVLVEGPLSGLGARMTIMSALFESSGFKTAMYVAGIAGLAAGFGFAAAAAVKATLKFQQWEASMLAASGASVLVAEDMDYIIKQSMKSGLELSATIPAWTSFATAARLTGMSIEETRRTFEAFSTAGSALHWNTEKVGHAFLALEQILSKGAPQMQEVRLQLGQVLPGAFALAARGLNMTTQQLGKAMEAGTIGAKEFVLAISDITEKSYRAAAVLGRQSLASDIGRYNTQVLLLSRSFDKAIGASSLFQAAIQTVIGALDSLERNMKGIIAAVGATIIALGLFAMPAIVGGILAIGRAIQTATMAMIAFGAATTATPLGLLATILLRIGAAAVGGALAFNYFKGATEESTKATEEYIKKLKDTALQLEEQETISQKLKDRILNDAQPKLAALDAEEKKLKALMIAYHNVEDAQPDNKPSTGEFDSGDSGTKTEKISADQLSDAVKKLNLVLLQKRDIMTEINRISNLPIREEEDAVSKQKQSITNFIEHIRGEAERINDSGDKYLDIMSKAEEFARKNSDAFGGWASDSMVEFLNTISTLALPIKEFQDQERVVQATSKAFGISADAIAKAKDSSYTYLRAMEDVNKGMEENQRNIGMNVHQRELAEAAWNDERKAVEAYDDSIRKMEERKRKEEQDIAKIKNIKDRQAALDAYVAASEQGDEVERKIYEEQLARARDLSRVHIDLIKKRIAAEEEWANGAINSFNRYMDEAGNAARSSGELFTHAFQNAEDAFVNFVQTGKLSFKNLIDTMIADSIRFQVRQAMFQFMGSGAPGGGVLGGLGHAAMMQMGGAGGLGGFLANTFGFGYGDAAGLAAGVPQFASGIDYVPQDMLAFVHKGEKIETAAENAKNSKGGMPPMTVVNQFHLSQPADRRTQSQIASLAGVGIQRALARNN